MDSRVEVKTCHIGEGSYHWKASGALTPGQAVRWESSHEGCSKEVSICYVSDLLEPDEVTKTFKYPEVVEEMHIDGIISHNNFDKLLRPLRHLKLLEIHLFSLQNLHLERKLGLAFQFPHLQSLSISSYGLATEYPEDFKIDGVILNFSLLLRMTFPSLSFLAVSIPFVKHQEHDMIEAILKCMKIHFRTLKSLNVECTFEIPSLHITSHAISKIPEFLRCEIEVSDLKDVQLHSFHFLSTLKTQGTKIWRKFLRSQKKLEYLQFWCKEKFYPLPTLLIHHNFRSIHTIALNIDPLLGTNRNSTKTEIDCGALQKCLLLKTLVLRGKPRDPDDSNVPPDVHHFKNFHVIPKGLNHLRLSDLNLAVKDARIIAWEMPHLIQLFLENVGETGNLGMALKDLAHLLGKEDPKLASIDIHNGINLLSVDEVKSNNTDGYATLIRIIFKANRPPSFTAVLGENGEYDLISDDGSNVDDNFFEDEIFHEDFSGNVSEESIDELDRDVVTGEQSNTKRVHWLQDKAKVKVESDTSEEVMQRRNSVYPIQLCPRSVTKYIQSREKAIKVPKTPTIHESLSEASDQEELSSEDEDGEFVLSKVSSFDVAKWTQNYDPNSANMSQWPKFRDAHTSMDFGT